MRQKVLIQLMDVHELMDWMSFDLSQNEEFKSKEELEEQKTQSAEEEARRIKDFFQGFG